MSPKKLPTTKGDSQDARARRKIAEKYLEVAMMAKDEGGAAVNVCVGVAVLAGIAASDAICLTAIGERYSGQDHAAAADLLARVEPELGKRLRDLVGYKPLSHYGTNLLSEADRTKALRAARALTEEAARRAG